jgi:anthranilate synthase component I
MESQFDIIGDLDTPVSAFLKLSTLGPRFLLESVEGGERVGRYSFIGFGRCLEVVLEGSSLRVGEESVDLGEGQGALLEGLREALARAPRPGPVSPDLPFCGGLVGVAGYDLVRRFERLPSCHPLDQEGLGEPEAAYVAPESLLIFDHATRRIALLHDGSQGDRAKLRSQVIELLRGPTPEASGGGQFTTPEPSLSKAAYEDGVRRVRESIVEGDVYQLVLSSRFEGQSDIPPFEVYRALRLLNPSPYMYFFQLEELSVIGSSPEALVKLKGREATLRPIAGTRPRGRNREQDLALEEELLADPKEAAEHVMLVDLARNDLGRVAVPGSVEVKPSRIVERYSHVMHIVSGVQGELEAGCDQFDLFAATFPAGTVVGAPKVRAMELIDELEPVRRGIYAGTVGYFGHDNHMDQAIAIRTIVFQGERYAYQAGAGVVADSVPEREHAEIMAKGAAVGAALKLAGEGL